MKIITSTTAKLSLLVFLLSSGFFVGGARAEASSSTWTYTYSWPAGDVCTGGDSQQCSYDPGGSKLEGTFSASTDKNSYAPGETIKLTLSAVDNSGGSCAFLSWNCTSKKGMRITASVGGSVATNNQQANWTVGTLTLTAPTTLGYNVISLDGGWYDTSNFRAFSSMGITVAAPSCSANGTVYWNASGANTTGPCQQAVNVTTPSGSSTTLTNTASGYTGSATFGCNGSWTGPTAVSCTPAVTGVCDNSGGYNCAAGSMSSGSGGYSSGGWKWYCDGTPNDAAHRSPQCHFCITGNTWNGSACVASVTGVCNATHYNCNAGTLGSTAEYATDWQWWCNGTGGGTNTWCSESKNCGAYPGTDSLTPTCVYNLNAPVTASGGSYTTTSVASPAGYTGSRTWNCNNKVWSAGVYTCTAPISYVCTGTIPANASMFSNDNVSLTVNTPYTYYATDTGTRCQYSCNSTYTWNGSSCVPPVATTPTASWSPSSITIASGDTVPYISYSSTNATRCTIYNRAANITQANLATSGSWPAGTFTGVYTTSSWGRELTCYNSLGTASAIAFLTVTVTATSSTTPPAEPTGQTQSCNTTGTQVTLSWNAATGATSYPVRVDDPAGSCNGGVTGPATSYCTSGIEYVNDGLTSTSITVNITPGTTYNWWVHAVNANGWSSNTSHSFSCPASATTVNGVCSTTAETCIAGTYSNSPADTATNSQWTCLGAGSPQGTSSGTCTATIAATCPGDPAPASQTVTSSTSGTVWGKGPFTTDSSLPAIARFLGANGNARLTITDRGCLPSFGASTQNGVTTYSYGSWRGMSVIMTPLVATATVNGVCNATPETCTAGTYSNSPADTATGSQWTCLGMGSPQGTSSGTCTAAIPSYFLAVFKSGTGSGTVTSSPAGISCGTTCSAIYTSGTSVTLTATPTSGTFAGWTYPGCPGTGTCTVLMTASQAVLANFTRTIATTYSCTGLRPSNTTIYSGDITGLGADTPFSYSPSPFPGNTVAKCEFDCNSGYNWDSTTKVCVLNCSSNCSATANSHCSGSPYPTTDSCGNTETCTGTKSCNVGNFNWVEVAP